MRSSVDGKCPPESRKGGAPESTFWQGMLAVSPPPTLSPVLLKGIHESSTVRESTSSSGVVLPDFFCVSEFFGIASVSPDLMER
mmetsp:Transcript_1904/g.4180  ORF Transcript_1904/g.4180 Transcript_1904/m.4180 type:complete len:84 (-) Transcript_1904:759-1010(-)|eukprot:scaffold1048_cov90-Amphora_coffeaeformis.AAC.11